MNKPLLQITRRLPVGAEVQPNKGVHFRVWAPDHHRKIAVVIEGHETQHNGAPKTFTLEPEGNGYFSGFVKEASDGTLYRYQIDEGEYLYPDPVSRYQPDGPHGPSQVIDPAKFQWTDQNWKGVPDDGRVLYELHIGTFTHDGTWESAKQEMLRLSELGITIIEMMPVAEFPGNFGWGYDGVALFAPYHLYGHPDDLRNFIDYAHAIGMSVILDVVYNHFGPDGTYVGAFTKNYFNHRHITDWGDAINFDGKGSEGCREFFIANAGYWIDEFHFDGLRLDATQNIYDDSSTHILIEIGQQVRRMAPDRKTYIIAENESQQAELVMPLDQGGYGLDAVWNDDWHHTALVRLTGRSEAYYTDYKGTPQEFISAIKYGYLYQGQWYLWQARIRGTCNFHLSPQSFISFIQNHDQIANSAHGLRIHQLTDPGNFRAMTTLMLLGPNTPMLFQGQEFAANAPFYYFADHIEELSDLVFKGRKAYFKKFASIATPEIQAVIPNPSALQTFEKSKIDSNDRERHAHIYALHRDLLRMRHNDSVFSQPRLRGVEGAVLSSDAFILRFFGEDENDTRLLIINFGVDLDLSPIPEPLLAAPKGTIWNMLWSSEDSIYGGGGTPPHSNDQHWRMLGHAAIVLIPRAEQKETAL